MINKTEKVKDYFNATDNYLKNNLEIAIRSSLIEKNLYGLNDKRILDVGCGNGELTLPYISKNKITFLDFSEKMLEVVWSKIPENYRHNAELLNIDLENLEPGKKYDYIFLIGVLAHVNSIEQTIGLLEKLLAKDGRMIIQFTNRRNLISILTMFIFFRLKPLFKKKPEYKFNYTSLHSIKAELEKKNLRFNKKVNFWPVALPGFGFFPEGIRKFVYYKVLNGWLLKPLGSEILLFVSKNKES
jgi:2-polyprenyl-3-methyl-5-hydroxy-6-metoxy-1,4-benzoquinol methylase